jgi:hypothetical protein
MAAQRILSSAGRVSRFMAVPYRRVDLSPRRYPVLPLGGYPASPTKQRGHAGYAARREGSPQACRPAVVPRDLNKQEREEQLRPGILIGS